MERTRCEARRRAIAELWAADGSHLSEASVRQPPRAIEAEAREAFEANAGPRLRIFRPPKLAGSPQCAENRLALAGQGQRRTGGGRLEPFSFSTTRPDSLRLCL